MPSATQNLKLKVGREARVRFNAVDAAGVPVNLDEVTLAAAVRLADCDEVQLPCVALDAEVGLFQILFPSFPSPSMGGWSLAITIAGVMREYVRGMVTVQNSVTPGQPGDAETEDYSIRLGDTPKITVNTADLALIAQHRAEDAAKRIILDKDDVARLTTLAQTAERDAKTSASEASQSNLSAQSSAATATTHATSAQRSATLASSEVAKIAQHESNAVTAANTAQQSATLATSKATEASQSANTAQSSATSAVASATTATTKANEASTSATTSTIRATEASQSATSAKQEADRATHVLSNAASLTNNNAFAGNQTFNAPVAFNAQAILTSSDYSLNSVASIANATAYNCLAATLHNDMRYELDSCAGGKPIIESDACIIECTANTIVNCSVYAKPLINGAMAYNGANMMCLPGNFTYGVQKLSMLSNARQATVSSNLDDYTYPIAMAYSCGIDITNLADCLRVRAYKFDWIHEITTFITTLIPYSSFAVAGGGNFNFSSVLAFYVIQKADLGNSENSKEAGVYALIVNNGFFLLKLANVNGWHCYEGNGNNWSLTVQTKQLSHPSKIIFAKMDTFYSMPGIYNAGDTYDVLEHKSIHLVGTESITTEHHTRV